MRWAKSKRKFWNDIFEKIDSLKSLQHDRLSARIPMMSAR